MASQNQWDKRYSDSDYVYGTAPNDFLVASQKHLKPDAKVLCLAEGEGRNSVWLARQGFRVHAVDASDVGRTKAMELAAQYDVEIDYTVADLSDFELGESSWDGIISIFCHLPPPLRKKLYGDIPASLRPGGVLILEGYRPKQLDYKTGGPPVEELLISEDQIREELGTLDIFHCTELDREIHEGKLHNGMGAVCQFIGFKI